VQPRGDGADEVAPRVRRGDVDEAGGDVGARPPAPEELAQGIRPEVVDGAPELLGDDPLDERVAAREVVVDGGPGDAGGLADVLEADDAVRPDHGVGDRPDRLGRAFGRPLPQGA
jgi:hypothetical protein